VKVREPVARPLDVVAVELLLSASQAFVVGVLMYLAIGVWDDRGVGVGSVAVILALLGLAVGGTWLYWLMGGVGWPMAAANVPVAMFVGFAMVLGWAGDDLFRVAGVPLLLALLAAVYGIVGGVFIESPRRWRWDQRQKLRTGTKVPHVSGTTRALVAAMPRSLPSRSPAPASGSDLAARIEQSTPPGPEPSGDIGAPYVHTADEPGPDASLASESAETSEIEAKAEPERRGAAEDADDAAARSLPPMPTQRLQRGAPDGAATAKTDTGDDEPVSIELPTMVEPKAQRSPWAWAAPPEWNRDEDDDSATDRPSGRL
jgi:hypothetical protein